MPAQHPPSPTGTDDQSEDDDLVEREREAQRNSHLNSTQSSVAPSSPQNTRFPATLRADARDARPRLSHRHSYFDETSGLLSGIETPSRNYESLPPSAPSTPGGTLRRAVSQLDTLPGYRARHPSRRSSFILRRSKTLGVDSARTDAHPPHTKQAALYFGDRVWYDQFTSTDWVHDSIKDAFRVKKLRSRKDWRGRLSAFFDGAQGWILVFIIGIITAGFAYFIDLTEATIFDIKKGYCTSCWWYSKRKCCNGASTCDGWVKWSSLSSNTEIDEVWVDFVVFTLWVVILSLLSCFVTLQTKTSVSSVVSLATLDENLAADHHNSKWGKEDLRGSSSPTRRFREAVLQPPLQYYPAAGSGVAEVKVILSGFVLHGYLGLKTLVLKSFGLILSVASGLSIGKEGPYVHIATCIGNVAARFFPKYGENDGKRREVLAASAAAGVAVAFGAPIGGVLFSLEEVSYYFPHKTLFRTFSCCIAAALSLKFFDPYGTGKIVLFEVRYYTDWKFFEIVVFILLGVMGGLTGALFIKASRFWAKTFRRLNFIKKYPMLEVLLVAIATSVFGYWNRYTRLPVAELLFELSSPCDAFSDTGFGLCPTEDRIVAIIWYLFVAFIIKALLTVVTFGVKVPAGIYVPSMVIGGLLGRIVGHLVQWLTLAYPTFGNAIGCTDTSGNPESCVVPGVYALVAAGATMCGVTRLSVTLAMILFELTGSLEHVLPFSLGVLVAKWTADAIEPLSIYDLLTDMNAYPYLDSKIRPVFTTDLGDITLSPHHNRTIDISTSPLVPAEQLRFKVQYMHMVGELDGGLPILRDGILLGLIATPDLEYALDRLEDEETALCLMSPQHRWLHGHTRTEDEPNATEAQPIDFNTDGADLKDFTSFVDQAPVSLDVCSPMDLVFECFVKLGLRYICVLKEGKFAGLVHKKAFVRYVKDLSEGAI